MNGVNLILETARYWGSSMPHRVLMSLSWLMLDAMDMILLRNEVDGSGDKISMLIACLCVTTSSKQSRSSIVVRGERGSRCKNLQPVHFS
jgi:hypothetical protein